MRVRENEINKLLNEFVIKFCEEIELDQTAAHLHELTPLGFTMQIKWKNPEVG